MNSEQEKNWFPMEISRGFLGEGKKRDVEIIKIDFGIKSIHSVTGSSEIKDFNSRI